MRITLSTKNFTKKPKGELFNLTYSLQDITPIELYEKIIEGYCYQGHYDYQGTFTFKGIGAKTQHYIGSWVVSIDIDHFDDDMETYLKSLQVKPTFAYETFSNKKNDYCFRLCYCFNEEIIGKESYSRTYEAICDRNGIKFYDKRATSPYQYFNGTKKTANHVWYGVTFGLSDWGVHNNIIRNETFNKDKNLDGKGYFSEELVKDLESMHYNEIVTKYQGVYRNKQSSPIPKVSDDVKIIPLPKDFYEIVRPWERGSSGTRNNIIRNETFGEKGYIRKLKNGEHRRLKLFYNLCIRRLIIHDLTLDELLYAACYEMNFFIDNPIEDEENYISKRQVMSIVLSAYRTNLDDFHYKRPRESMVNYRYCQKYGVSKQQIASQIANEKKTQIKKNKQELFFEMYDDNKTIKENIANFTETTGIKVGLSTVKRWKSERGTHNNIIRNETTKNYAYPTFEDTDNGMVNEDFFVNYLFEKDFEYEYTRRT